MKGRRPVISWLVLGAALVSITAGCRGLPQGPSLSNVTVSPLRLEPTLDDPALCCCRIVGSVRNDNRVPVHATFKFSAFDGERTEAISSILFFIPDFQPRTDRPIDAHGFIFPCNVIKELKTELDIKGIAFPPL
jgi:hypothetical protein